MGIPGNIGLVTIKYAVSKKFRSKKKDLKKGELHKVLLIASRFGISRYTGTYLKGPSNACIILRKENLSLPYANRIRRPIFREANTKSKVMAIAPNIHQ